MPSGDHVQRAADRVVVTRAPVCFEIPLALLETGTPSRASERALLALG
jgi:hypothetical protein